MKELTMEDMGLYLGCECFFNGPQHYTRDVVIHTLRGVAVAQSGNGYMVLMAAYKGDLMWYNSGEHKPILRRWKSMTKEEQVELIKSSEAITSEDILSNIELSKSPNLLLYSKKTERMRHGIICGIHLDALEPNHFRWLLSHHFDLFGWIDVKLAIDKEKL